MLKILGILLGLIGFGIMLTGGVVAFYQAKWSPVEYFLVGVNILILSSLFINTGTPKDGKHSSTEPGVSQPKDL